MDPRTPTAIGLFAGVGGIEFGLSQAGFQILLANEIDKFASMTYRANHAHQLVESDISKLGSELIPSDLTVLAGGFPCQPFSVAGYRRGFDDDRGNVYWEIDRIYREKKPKVILLENVKNLASHDRGNTFQTIKGALGRAGYTVRHEVLNSSKHGNVPQNRERVYVVAFLSASNAKKFEFPEEIPLSKKLTDFIDFKGNVEEKYFYGEKTPFYDDLTRAVTSQETVYQWRRKYVRENKSGLCPTLTANMGMGGHNVPIILSDRGIRKLTPSECFALMGFPRMNFPSEMSDSKLYKQAGNAVVVPVVKRIGEQILKALD